MKSIKTIFKIGHGPSSSHTMAIGFAAEYFKNLLNEKDFEIEAVFYNSLNLTGNGHLTYTILKKELKPYVVTVKKELDSKKHPNFFILKAIKDNKVIIEKSFKSIGGGDLEIVGVKNKKDDIYFHKNFNEIKKYCLENNLKLHEYVYKFEKSDIKSYLLKIYSKMVKSIQRGIKKQGLLPGELKLERKANYLMTPKMKNEVSEIKENRLVSAYAYAVSEENAAGGIIVTAPTCGACGVLPSVLYYMQQKYKFINEDRIVNALAVAGLIANIIKRNATISGAVGGCQAEIGSATAITAAAHATLFNLDIEQIEYASEIALEHQLGLTCDPVMGYVQIPCIERNAVAAQRAINCCSLSYFLYKTRKVSLDQAIKTLYETGKDLKPRYKETSLGGLAKNYEK